MDRNWNLGKLLVDIERCFYHIKQINIEHIWHFGIVQTTGFFFHQKIFTKSYHSNHKPMTTMLSLFQKNTPNFEGLCQLFSWHCASSFISIIFIFSYLLKNTLSFTLKQKNHICCAAPFLANFWCNRIWEIHVFFLPDHHWQLKRVFVYPAILLTTVSDLQNEGTKSRSV